MRYEIENLNTKTFTENEGLVTHLIDSGDYYFHSHTFVEVFYIIEGSIKHVINGTTEILQTGDMYIIRPGDVHCFLRDSKTSCTHRDIMISPSHWNNTLDFIGNNNLYSQFKTGPIKAHLSTKNIHHMEYLLNQLSFYTQNAALLSSYNHIICADIARFLVDKVSQNAESLPFWILRLLQKLELPESYTQDFNDIIKSFSYNKSYMARTFKKHIGMTMSEYFTTCKVNYAALLLNTSESSIAEIAELSGFTNLSHFNRCFKTQFNCTPREYRKNVLL